MDCSYLAVIYDLLNWKG